MWVQTRDKEKKIMKQFMTMAKKSACNDDGFINGLIKGVLASSALIIVLAFMTGYTG